MARALPGRTMIRLIAIGFIWVGCAVAWVVLGSTIVHRTDEVSGSLNGEVYALWGPPRVQQPPRAVYRWVEKTQEKLTEYDDKGRPKVSVVEREETKEHPIPLVSSKLAVDLKLEHRRKGLLWFPTYGLGFDGRYAIASDLPQAHELEVSFPLESGSVVYDGFVVRDALGRELPVTLEQGRAYWTVKLAPGERHGFQVGYQSRGTSRFQYGGDGGLGGAAGQAKDFELVMKTNFANVDFPAGTLSPSGHAAKDGGWEGHLEVLEHRHQRAGRRRAAAAAEPGAARLEDHVLRAGRAAVLLLRRRGARGRAGPEHPPDELLLLRLRLLRLPPALRLPARPRRDPAELRDRLGGCRSSSSSATRACSPAGRFAVREMAIAQLIYLVLFSFTFFWDGFTGLAITIGAVLTLFVMMQITGRMDWRKATLPAVG